jgi:hypothetical protein
VALLLLLLLLGSPAEINRAGGKCKLICAGVELINAWPLSNN